MVDFKKIKNLPKKEKDIILSGDMCFSFGKYAKKNLKFKDVDYSELDRYLDWMEDQKNKSFHMQELIGDLTRYLSQEHIEREIREDLEQG